MDGNATTTSFLPPPPPPGLNYIAAIQPSIVFLMIGTIWTGILLPLVVALFFFSTNTTRRKPIFILNVLSLLLGLLLGIFNACTEIHFMLSPLQPWSSANSLAFSILTSYTPWLVEMILVVRLLAVYPYATTPKRLWFSIFIPLFLLKIARFVNMTIFTVQYVALLHSSSSGDPLAISQIAWNSHPGPKIEWVIQVLDNSACSILFISRLQIGLNAPERKQFSFNSTGGSYTSRLKVLFWIAVSNFVFPVILSIIQLVFIFRDPDFLKGTYIYVTNSFVEIIGVLLATVWTSSSHWEDSNAPSRGNVAESNPRFAARNVTSTFSSGVIPGSAFIQVKAKTGTEPSIDSEVELGHVESHPEFAVVEKTPGAMR